MSNYTIWHNPKCSTSRFVLHALRDAGADVTVRDYLAQPPSTVELRAALDRLGMAPATCCGAGTRLMAIWA